MIEWTHVDDQLLAYGTLKNDLLFHKIPKENYLYYINESLKLGKQKAKTYKYLSVEELCQKNHIEISYKQEFVKAMMNEIEMITKIPVSHQYMTIDEYDNWGKNGELA